MASRLFNNFNFFIISICCHQPQNTRSIPGSSGLTGTPLAASFKFSANFFPNGDCFAYHRGVRLSLLSMIRSAPAFAKRYAISSQPSKPS